MIPSLGRVDHFHVHVSDRAAAERWYAEVLNLRRVPELVFWASGRGPLTLGNAEDTVHLALFEGESVKGDATIAFAVSAPAFIEWQNHLAKRLGRVPTPVDHDVSWSIYFADPDGNGYEITSYDYSALSSALRTERMESLSFAN